jgi:hypothetical protein
MAGLFAHGVGLTFVLGHSSVDNPILMLDIGSSVNAQCNVLDDIWANWHTEDTRKRVSLVRGLAIDTNDGNSRSARHFGRYLKMGI